MKRILPWVLAVAVFCPVFLEAAAKPASIHFHQVHMSTGTIRLAGSVVRILSRDSFHLADGTGLIEVRLRPDPLRIPPEVGQYLLVEGEAVVSGFRLMLKSAGTQIAPENWQTRRYQELLDLNIQEEPYGHESIGGVLSGSGERPHVRVKGRILYFDAELSMLWVSDGTGRLMIKYEENMPTVKGKRFFAEGSLSYTADGLPVLYPSRTQVLPDRSGMLSSLLLE